RYASVRSGADRGRRPVDTAVPLDCRIRKLGGFFVVGGPCDALSTQSATRASVAPHRVLSEHAGAPRVRACRRAGWRTPPCRREFPPSRGPRRAERAAPRHTSWAGCLL